MKPTDEHPQQQTDSQDRGVHPAILVWRRFRRHRLGMGGTAVFMVVLLFLVVGPFLVPSRGDVTHLWFGARAPGSSHPIWPQRVVLSKGQT
ncbi:MAG: hypothetical protein D6820_06245, partial [Lentisphaerae bacterium]